MVVIDDVTILGDYDISVWWLLIDASQALCVSLVVIDDILGWVLHQL